MEVIMQQNLKRNIALTFRVSEEEKALVQRRMAQTNISNLRAYLLKMAVDGQVITVELDSVNECNRLLRNISNNINQIARRINETGNIYAADIEEIKTRQNEIWEQQSKTIKLLSDIVVAV
jgi:hypothetical protein